MLKVLIRIPFYISLMQFHHNKILIYINEAEAVVVRVRMNKLDTKMLLKQFLEETLCIYHCKLWIITDWSDTQLKGL